MAQVRLLGGKPLLVGSKVAISDDCCCSPTPPTACDCPLPDEDCPHSLSINVEFDDTDLDESDFIEFIDAGENSGIAMNHFDNGDGTHTIEAYSWGPGGFVDFIIPDADFFNVFFNICVKFNRIDATNTNVEVSIAGFGTNSFTMTAPTVLIDTIYVGARGGSGGAHRTISCVKALGNPDTSEPDFDFPTDSFDSFTGGASIVDGSLRIDDDSGDAYATKTLTTGYDLKCPVVCCLVEVTGASAAGQINICSGSANYQFPPDVAFNCSAASGGCGNLGTCGPQTSTFTESGGHCPDLSNQTTTFTVNSVVLTFLGASWQLDVTVTATVSCGCGFVTTTDTDSQILATLNGIHSASGTFASQVNLHWGATITISPTCP